MAGYALWIIGIYFAGCFLIPAPSMVLCYYQNFPQRFEPWRPRPLPPPPPQPVNVMTDVVNRLGTRVLMQYVENGNVAFSPAGLGFILSALYEGSGGRSRQQITDSLGLPRDRNVVRAGMRDMHARLRTYLNPDGFLGGLNLNRENTTLRQNYETILRFYGFDLNVDLTNFTNDPAGNNNFGLRGSMTTTLSPTAPGGSGTTMIPGMMDMAMTTLPSTTDGGAGTTTIDTTVVLLPGATTLPTTAAQMVTTQAPTTTAATTRPTPASIQAQTTTTTMAPTTTVTIPTTTMRRRPMTTQPIPTMMSMMMSSSDIISSTLPRTTMTTTTQMPTTTTEVPTTTFMFLEDIATVAAPTIATIPALIRRRRLTNLRRRRSNDGYFVSYPDDGLWMQDLDIWAEQPVMPSNNVRQASELQFLVNGCDLTNVPAASYSAILPFAYFPGLKAAAVEFPLDNPRYNVMLFLPSERVDTGRLARELGSQNLRMLRRQLQPTWTRATIPSFMLRGFVTLTSYLQRLGIKDVFEPRLADLSPMTPDLGVYARDVQQSIAVNIRNYMRSDDPNAPQPSNPLPTEMPLLLPQRRDPRFQRPVNGPLNTITFKADHPFLFFIIDDETSVALIAGRIDDPLNSRIL